MKMNLMRDTLVYVKGSGDFRLQLNKGIIMKILNGQVSRPVCRETRAMAVAHAAQAAQMGIGDVFYLHRLFGEGKEELDSLSAGLLLRGPTAKLRFHLLRCLSLRQELQVCRACKVPIDDDRHKTGKGWKCCQGLPDKDSQGVLETRTFFVLAVYDDQHICFTRSDGPSLFCKKADLFDLGLETFLFPFGVGGYLFAHLRVPGEAVLKADVDDPDSDKENRKPGQLRLKVAKKTWPGMKTSARRKLFPEAAKGGKATGEVTGKGRKTKKARLGGDLSDPPPMPSQSQAQPELESPDSPDSVRSLEIQSSDESSGNE